MSLLNRWHNFSISKKIYFVFGVMALLIGFELYVLSFAMQTLSSVRALVEGEGKWSKAQKDAVNSLQHYIITREAEHYYTFKKLLEVPLGDKVARVELAKEDPNIAKIYEGFIQGGMHVNDIPGVIELIKTFERFEYINNARSIWSQADVEIMQLMSLANNIRKKIRSDNFSAEDEHQALNEVEDINFQLTKYELEFSSTLGEASRALEKFLLISLLCLVILVEVTGLVFTFRFGRRLSRELDQLAKTTVKIGSGDFDQTVPVNTNDELGKLGLAINDMSSKLRNNILLRKEAEEVSKLKSLFLANMSHEIRTPLASIMGFAEVLDNEELSYEERKRYLNIIRSAGENLTDLINDILDISKVEAGSLSIKKMEFSLHDFLTDITNLLKLKCDQKKIRFHVYQDKDIPNCVVTDPVRLRQILINIVSNSIKFTDSGDVNLIASATKTHLVFDIKDTGIGIESSEQEKIFDTFYQIDNSFTRKHSGSGLGLPLSKHLAQLLGGELLLVESNIGKGSHFQVKVNYALASEKQVIQRNNIFNDISLAGRKILLVEDNENIRLLVYEILAKWGCQLEFAVDGADAIKKVESNGYDMVLMDIQMPEVRGLEAVKRLRSQGVTIPIFALSAHAMDENRQECLACGFDEFIKKPFTVETLIRTLGKHLQIEA